MEAFETDFDVRVGDIAVDVKFLNWAKVAEIH